MSSDKLISREEILAGLPAKRASTLLFLIENRTAHLAERSQLDFSLTESTANQRDMAFIEAFSLGQAPPLNLKIQHLERYAPQWVDLIPENPSLKAALIYAFGQKYNFTVERIPNISTALGLKQKSVRLAYTRQYQTSLETVFTTKLSLQEHLQWLMAKIAWCIEDLPPFWLATLITIALGLPQAFLALPIAAASMGALSSLVLVIALGLINILTMACMAEAIARSGDFRYGKALIKELAADYLGQAGSFILSVAVFIRVFLIALACYLGLSATIANLTSISASIWAAFLFSIGIYLLSRQSVKFTLGIMVFLAAINLTLLSGLSLMAFPHIEINNLFYTNLPFLAGEEFEPKLVQQIFGVSLMLYFGHVYVGECAKLVLPKDRSAGSLIKGSIAGTIVLTILFCIWILVVNGAIAPSLLAIQSGTVLEPLAQQIGSLVSITGSILVIFLLGMAWIRSSSLLFNITQEWIPKRHQPTLILPCRQGRLILQTSGKTIFPSLGITYLGLEQNIPHFRVDIQTNHNLIRTNLAITKHWDVRELSTQFADIRNLDLKLDLLSVTSDRAYLKVNSSMMLSYEGKLVKPEINQLALEEGSKKIKPIQRIKNNLFAQHRFFLAIIPLAIVFLLTEWLFLTQTQSFTRVLAFAGVLGNSLVGGIFPILLLVSSRRKGELVPEIVIDQLGHPLLLAGTYSLFIFILLIHGLFIWDNEIARFCALVVTILALGTTLVTILAGAFIPRTVVEIHKENNLSGKTSFNITTEGKPKPADISLSYGNHRQQYQSSTVEADSSLRSAICQLSTKGKEELKIWTHRRNNSGSYESFPTILEVHQGERKMQFDLMLSGGKILLPAIAGDYRLKFKFS